MSESLSADDLRARLSGTLPSDGLLLKHPTDTVIKMTKPTDQPCRSGHTDCTVDCGWCKGTGIQGGRPGNPLDMPGGGPPDIDITPPVPQRDLVASTLDRYRSEQAKDAQAAAAGRPNFRKAADAAPAGPPLKPNKYPGSCLWCDRRVGEGEGTITKVEGKWAVSHLTGQCGAAEPEVQATQAEVPASTTADPSQAVIKAVTGQVYTGVQPGIYTLENGVAGHRTFRVRVQKTDDDFAPGQTIIEFLSGPDNTRDYTGFGFLKGTRMNVWVKHRENRALVEDALAFLANPAASLEAATCIRCNATLTEPESIAVGMGPTCRNKGW